jgi:general secretion pathway protein D
MFVGHALGCRIKAMLSRSLLRRGIVAPPALACATGIPGANNCAPSKQDFKQARDAYQRGVKLESAKRLEEAFTQLDKASSLVPQSLQFLTAREMVKAQLVFDHVERGNVLLAAHQEAQAAAAFRSALQLDPENQFAQQRLRDALQLPLAATGVPEIVVDSPELRLLPGARRATFHYRGDVRGLFQELASAYGLTATFDESVTPRQVRFFLEDVDFFTALRLACQSTKNMWTALSGQQVLIAADSAENHRQLDRMSLRTFAMPAHTTSQEVNDLITAMRHMFDLKFVTPGQTANIIEVRAPQPVIEELTQLLDQLSAERPQVVLEVNVYEINHNLTRDMGVHVPNQFQLFNIPVAALAGLGGQNIQDLINQLIASGGINQAGSTAISALLAQLGGQGSSVFNQPLATFGGGLTFSGLSLDQFTATLSLNESWVRNLEHVTLRASQGNDATLHLGTRFPVLNGTYAPLANSAAISKVLGNQSYVAPFPSVSYEDLGLNIKAKAVIHPQGDVSLALELQERSLTGQSANGVPVISNREYNGSMNLRDGEPAVIAGELSTNDQHSLTGIPGLGGLPVLNQVMVNNTREVDDDELLIVITPHVVASRVPGTSEIWLSEK